MSIESDNFEKYIDDLDFIQWVQSGCDMSNTKWAQLKHSDNSINDAIAFVESLQFETTPISSNKKRDLFTSIEETIDKDIIHKNEPRKSSIVRYLVPALAAASLLLLITLFWPSEDSFKLSTSYAEMTNHQLPESSVIRLNADSKIAYDKSKFKNERTLNFEGEGFFEVEKGGQFVVETQLGKVEVLGTSFNVHARENTFEVFCKTGKVKVTNPSENSYVILNPGESSVLENNKLVKVSDKTPSDSWMSGKFYFKDKSLKIIVAELERQFDVKVKLAHDKEDIPYTGFFENSDINEALKSICWPLRLTFKQNTDGSYTIE